MEEGCRSVSFHAASSAVRHFCYAQMKTNAVPDTTREILSRLQLILGCGRLTTFEMATA